jgi:hypothetical protein
MPIHDWTRVHAGIFHDFHHEWISTIRRALNSGILPSEYYALAEQQAAGFGPDVLTLQADGSSDGGGIAATLQAQPKTRFVFESDAEFYRRKKSSVVIRHVSGDRIVAIVEIVSPGNKASKPAFRAFIDKACELLEYRIHLLIVDLFPPTKRDPNGVHAAIWEEVEGEPFQLTPEQPLTLASYECGLTTKAYVEPVAVEEALPKMALFLEPNGCVEVPLEKTYQEAFEAVPRRWKDVLESK